MTGKGDDKKIGRVQSTKETKSVERTESVDEVSGVKAATGVGAVKGPGGIGRRATRTMTLAERQQLFEMINEEADKLFGAGAANDKKKEVIKSAVKMAVDSGLIDEDDDEKPKKPAK